MISDKIKEIPLQKDLIMVFTSNSVQCLQFFLAKDSNYLKMYAGKIYCNML